MAVTAAAAAAVVAQLQQQIPLAKCTFNGSVLAPAAAQDGGATDAAVRCFSFWQFLLFFLLILLFLMRF